MLVFGRVICLIILLCISFGISVSQYESHENSLYVAGDSEGKIHVINRHPHFGRRRILKRHRWDDTAPTIEVPSDQQNISKWTTHLNISQQQLMIHYVGKGSNVILCLARDYNPVHKKSQLPSALFISYDYGKNYTNKTESFRLGDKLNSGYAKVDYIYNHPKHPEFCVFTDETNKKLFYTKDHGRHINRLDLIFHPSVFVFDDTSPEKYVILDKIDSNRKLYLTLDGGKTFDMIQSNVKMFNWSFNNSSSNMFYIERLESDGTTTVLSASDPTDLDNAVILFEEARDFKIKEDFIFATKQSIETNTLDLYISYKRGPFYKAVFHTELSLKKFEIVDIADNRIFVSVVHNATFVNLYVSEISQNYTQYDFILSLERIMSHFPGATWIYTWLKSVTEKSFTDLYRVEGLSGIYIASRVISNPNDISIRPAHLKTFITFDHGFTWSPINPPKRDDYGKRLNCHLNDSCSLHLCQKFSQLHPVYRTQGIVSSKSAPGILMATGVLGTSLEGSHKLYLSKDAGHTWNIMGKVDFLYDYGDHGGVLVAVNYFITKGKTRDIFYSTNDGIKWNSYQFNTEYLSIYGILNEPGKNTTTFTMFGLAPEQFQWIIITIDFKNTFARKCTYLDYEYWSPGLPNSSVSCVLGARKKFQRRLADTNCYNGNYVRPFKNEICHCDRRDFECDLGFMLLRNECIPNKSVSHDSYVVPADCRPGNFYEKTKGYRKIDGDVCTVVGHISYIPDKIPCPIKESNEFLLVALDNKIARIDLLDNSIIYPVVIESNIIAIEFDMKNNCVYYADIFLDKIYRQCFNNGMSEEVIVDNDLSTIDGMAFDWTSNVLFFVNTLKRKIEAIRTDTTVADRMRVTILDSRVLYKPRGIAVHLKEGYLFWTDCDSDYPSISRSNLDGTDVQKLFGKPTVAWPNGIAIDYILDRIVWVEALETYIGSADLNGGDFKKIIWNNDRVAHPFAITVLKDKMFWDDWTFNSISSAYKDFGTNITVINKFSNSPMGLKAYSHSILEINNPCSYKNISCDGICLGKHGNNFICLCPNGLHNVNGTCMCDNNTEPFTNMTCPQKMNSTCNADDFMCGNGKCVRRSERCNNYNDCGDMSDEISCPCEPPLLSCDNNLCYTLTKKCDGVFDCIDKSDEKDCSASNINVTTQNALRNCTADEFQCDNGKCILKAWACDGDFDCFDHSDERNCKAQSERPAIAPAHSTQQYCCSDGKCIPNTLLCDGDRDCKDGQDENEQVCKELNCTLTQSRCPNLRCIPSLWLCDGQNDCGDYSDEKDCKYPSNIKPNPHDPDSSQFFTCAPYTFTCGDGICIPIQWYCDGSKDCSDGSDESNCSFAKTNPSESPPCLSYLFRCPNGRCIYNTWICDGDNDCGDENASDEKNCEHNANSTPISTVPTINTTKKPKEITCGDWLYKCDDTCVPIFWICDGIKDCNDGTDEINCRLNATTNTPAITTNIPEITTNTPAITTNIPVTTTEYPTPPSTVSTISTTKKPKEKSCGDGLFKCDDTCAPIFWICDGIKDCNDGTDEINCHLDATSNIPVITTNTPVTTSDYPTHSISNCGKDFFACTSGVCVPQQKVCDGFIDCVDADDENNCINKETTTHGVVIPVCEEDTDMLCKDGIICVPNEKICDGFAQCTDEGDEDNCPYIPLPATNDTGPSKLDEWLTLSWNGFTVQPEVATLKRINATSIRLEWHPIDVDEYIVYLRLPQNYGRRSLIITKTNTVTLSNLPSGIHMYVDIQANTFNQYHKIFAIPVHTEGIKDDTINFTIVPSITNGSNLVTAVNVVWSPPNNDRYKGKELQYEVHYSNSLRGNYPGEMYNETKVITKNTSILIENLQPCDTYIFTVGILNGPLADIIAYFTADQKNTSVANLRVHYSEDMLNSSVLWDLNCGVTYALDITELTNKAHSSVLLQYPKGSEVFNINLPLTIGARYNVCVHVDVKNAEKHCLHVHGKQLEPPSGVKAWLLPNGYVMVLWDHKPQDMTIKYKYEVIVSPTSIPEDLLRPTADMKFIEVEKSPCLITVPDGVKDILYVAVRAVTSDGFHTEMSMTNSTDLKASALFTKLW